MLCMSVTNGSKGLSSMASWFNASRTRSRPPPSCPQTCSVTWMFSLLCAGRERATAPARGRAARRTCDLPTSGSIMRRWRWRTWRKLRASPHPDTTHPSSPARTSHRSLTANQKVRLAARAATQVQGENVQTICDFWSLEPKQLFAFS